MRGKRIGVGAFLLFGLMVCCTIGEVFAQTHYESTTFYARKYVKDGKTMPYRVMFPEGYDAPGIEPFPLIVFLHGEDERGDDNVVQMKYMASLFKSRETRDYFPAVVLFPQCPEDDAWALYDIVDDGTVVVRENPEQTDASRMVEMLIKHYTNKSFVNGQKVYLVGLSMGGFGVLDLAARNPKGYAAVVSLGGGLDPSRAKKMKKLPVRLFHGTDDPLVPASTARELYAALKETGSYVVDFVEYPEVKHDCWTMAISSADFLDWIFQYSVK